MSINLITVDVGHVWRQNLNILALFDGRYEVRAGRPILTAYLQRVKDKLNPHYDEVHSVGTSR